MSGGFPKQTSMSRSLAELENLERQYSIQKQYHDVVAPSKRACGRACVFCAKVRVF